MIKLIDLLREAETMVAPPKSKQQQKQEDCSSTYAQFKAAFTQKLSEFGTQIDSDWFWNFKEREFKKRNPEELADLFIKLSCKRYKDMDEHVASASNYEGKNIKSVNEFVNAVIFTPSKDTTGHFDMMNHPEDAPHKGYRLVGELQVDFSDTVIGLYKKADKVQANADAFSQNEVKQLKKAAGVLREDDEDVDYADEWANVPNTVEGWIDYLYQEATPKQKAKLANIYREQMEFEGATDAYEFFTDLIDSDDPDAIIPLEDLNQYSGY